MYVKHIHRVVNNMNIDRDQVTDILRTRSKQDNGQWEKYFFLGKNVNTTPPQHIEYSIEISMTILQAKKRDLISK